MPVQQKILLYSLKVWLTSVIISPFIFLIVDMATHNNDNDGTKTWWIYISGQFQIYFGLTVIELIMSFLTWLVFLIVIVITSLIVSSRKARRYLFTIQGFVLAIATFCIIMPSEFAPGHDFFVLAVTNCLSIAVGAFIYKIEINGKIDITDIY